MRSEGRRALGVLAALLAVVAATATSAVAAGFLLPVPGLRAGAVELGGVVRTADGGALIAAWLRSGRRAASGRLVLARVQADGALDLAYGSEGISAPTRDPHFMPTALAVDPASGAAWVGGRLSGGAGAILALDGSGKPRRAFGGDGLLRLPAADAGGPVSMAWSPAALLVAAGSGCRGCSLSLRDPVDGRLRASVQLGAAAGGGCSVTGVTGAIFAGAGSELVSTELGDASSCTGSLRAFDRTLQPVQVPAPSWLSALRTSVVGGGPGAVCAAGEAGSHWLVGPLGAAPGAQPAATRTGALVGLSALGPGACAALVRPGHGGAQVTQVGAGAPVAATLPASVGAFGMFRCHAHLLVLGTVARAAGQQVVLDTVPIRRGRYAAVAAAAASARRTTGCR